jgi:imidazolonepropionase-like amidohydrolase
MDLLEAGVDGFTHIFLDEPPNDHFIKIMKSRNVHCNPTLSLCASQTAERQEWQQTFRRDPFARSMLIEKTFEKPLGLAKAERPRAGVQHAYETTRKLYQAGIPLIAGSDCAGQGFGVAYGLGVHIEMYLFAHEIGMSPEDVLKSATSTTAARFGFEDRGEISVGKKADLALVEGDIADVLSDPKNRCLPIVGVWRDGVLASIYERGYPEFVQIFDTDI